MLAKLTKRHLGDLTVGARSWRPLAPDPHTGGGIHANKGRFLAASETYSTSSRLSDSGSEPRVNLVAPATVGDSTSSLGEDFEREARAFEAAQERQQLAKDEAARAEVAAAEVRSRSSSQVDHEGMDEHAAAEVARDIDEQQRRYEMLAAAQQELAAREREVQEKEERLNQLMQEEEARAALEIVRSTENAEREEAETQQRLEQLELDAQAKRAELEALLKQEEQERENTMKDKMERERLKREEDERDAFERHIAEEKAEAEARRNAHRADIFTRQTAIRDRHQQRQNLIANLRAPERLPVRAFEPIKFAHVYHTPSAASFMVPSPRMPMSPFFIPEDVRRAGKADAAEREFALQETAEEMRRMIDQLEGRTRRLAIERDRENTVRRERDEDEKRRRSADLEEVVRDMRVKEAKARKATAELARLAAEEEQLLRQKERAQVAAKALEQETELAQSITETDESSLASSLSEGAARKRGAEAAAYYMAKQSLSRKGRPRPALGSRTSTTSSKRSSNSSVADSLSPSSNSRRPRGLTKRRASDGHIPPVSASVPTRPMEFTNSPHGREPGVLMTPHPGHDISPAASRGSSPPPRRNENFIVVSGDNVEGYSHDELQVIEASALRDVGRTPAIAYISGAEAGRDENKEGKMAAVRALVEVAEKMGADAILSLRLQPPKPVDDTKVEYTAYGIAVTLKFLSPERPAPRSLNSSQIGDGRRMFDDTSQLYQISSAPPRGLSTPSEVGSTPFASPFQTTTPKGENDQGDKTPKAREVPHELKEGGRQPSRSSTSSPGTSPLPSPKLGMSRIVPITLLEQNTAVVASAGNASGSRSRSMPPQHVDEEENKRQKSLNARKRDGVLMSRSRSATGIPRMQELWVGEGWEEQSPTISGLSTPLAPAPLELLNTPKGHQDWGSLIDLEQDLGLLGAPAKNMMSSWMEDLASMVHA